jgi:hypothetical protein
MELFKNIEQWDFVRYIKGVHDGTWVHWTPHWILLFRETFGNGSPQPVSPPLIFTVQNRVGRKWLEKKIVPLETYQGGSGHKSFPKFHDIYNGLQMFLKKIMDSYHQNDQVSPLLLSREIHFVYPWYTTCELEIFWPPI